MRGPRYTVTDLGTLGGSETSALGINNLGQVVGWSLTPNGVSRAFVWSTNYGMVDLGTLGGRSSSASATNDAGQVVGWAETAAGEAHAFIFGVDAAGQVVSRIDLGTLGSVTRAYGTNASGQVVGDSRDYSRGSVRSFLYRDGQLHDLGGFYASAINSAGDIVGDAQSPDGAGSRAFLFTGGVMLDLETLVTGGLGDDDPGALAINDAGQIVGSGMTDHYDVRLACLLNPLPEAV